MARTVQCIKLGTEAEGLDFPPYPGDLGKRIWESVSKKAWARHLGVTTAPKECKHWAELLACNGCDSYF